MKIGIVAGESSGDIIGSRLIRALHAKYSDVSFYGLAGPKMIEAGCTPIVHMHEANVMGFGHVIKKLPQIYKMKKKLLDHYRLNVPDIFIGIDFTDFNLNLANQLKRLDVKIVQYKGPSVWAWRPSRKNKVAKIVDLLLTIFPFEQKAYENIPINARYVGHPIAQEVPLYIDSKAAKKILNITDASKIIAILPGSRDQEIKSLGSIYIQTLAKLSKLDKNLIFICGHLNNYTKNIFIQELDKLELDLNIRHVVDDTRNVLEACDVALVTSGTATFETMLYKKPMVVAYKVSWIVEKILSRLLKTKFISLPNLLANREIVKEYTQKDVNPKNLSTSLIRALEDEEYKLEVSRVFTEIHSKLQMDIEYEIVKNIDNLLKA